MPLYEFECERCSRFEAAFPMAGVPQDTSCPTCHGRAVRRMSAPRLSKSSSAAYGLIDRAAQSAESPQVVSGSIPGRAKATTRYTANPLHQKLPRP